MKPAEFQEDEIDSKFATLLHLIEVINEMQEEIRTIKKFLVIHSK